MAIRVALSHRTKYGYDKQVMLSPQLVRLRPAPHTRTPILAYSLKVGPQPHFLNWQQDAYSNYQARLVFPEPVDHLELAVDLIAELTVINPFDFFIDDYAEKYPFQCESGLARELAPYLEVLPVEPRLQKFVEHAKAAIARPGRRMVDVLVEINQLIQTTLGYDIRMEPGVQTPEETLTKCHGSCRDFTWLMVQVVRQLGLAARFVSGYSIQLMADQKPLEGPSGVTQDVTDLHAWTEVYLPGAGWVGFDSTSGLMAGEGHIPLAATADPSNAAPVTGGFNWLNEEGKDTFEVSMKITRIHEDPRVTKPYTEQQWLEIAKLGHQVDEELQTEDVRLTMGGEPTFVSIDDMEGAEWTTSALGPDKRRISAALIKRLREKFSPGGLLHFGQGKWYPGESLPRYAFGCYWRKDGVPVWEKESLVADEGINYGHDSGHAKRFIETLAQRLHVNGAMALPAFEDVWYYLWKERRLPSNVDPLKCELSNEEERKRLAKVFEQGLAALVGYALPLRPAPAGASARWETGAWFLRPERMYLVPGDSPMGYRLPLDSLPWVTKSDAPVMAEQDPLEERGSLPDFRGQGYVVGAPTSRHPLGYHNQLLGDLGRTGIGSGTGPATGPATGPGSSLGLGNRSLDRSRPRSEEKSGIPQPGESASWIVRTALCVEARQGRLHVFMPPQRYLEDYLELIARVEETADILSTPVIIEGYAPPKDPRLNEIKVTPDPGVIEVNIHPAGTWDELVNNTTVLYEEARQSRLGTEKFQLDGRHTGTGGGNHVVIGGPTAADSPILRRPDLLKSLVGYWNNHPSLSYLFSGMFVGPTSQAPRADESRADLLYELDIAFRQVPPRGELNVPPWIVDRIFRNLLVDSTGNTHRAEFCIDKLYAPESPTGRLGLVEFRGYEMPPHPRMSLTQQLLLRSLISRFWKQPYEAKLVRWGTELHDRFMLPHFVWQDFHDVLFDMNQAGYAIQTEWFAPHFEFRFPHIGSVNVRDVEIDLRQAIEPWYVLGEEPVAGGTVRFVDSSVERLQIRARGMTDTRHVVMCNGRPIPLHNSGTRGEFVAGVRYKAWAPPEALHPPIHVHTPLVFDVVDTWNGRSVGGCTYHVSHPAGRNYTTFPVNAFEAESRRVARFFKFGHTQGPIQPTDPVILPEFPFTLDLRRELNEF